MKKSEMEHVMTEQQALINRHKARVKLQNDAAKERWDSVSCRLPKGTCKRITDRGLTVNGLINALVLAELDRLDKIDKQEGGK